MIIKQTGSESLVTYSGKCDQYSVKTDARTGGWSSTLTGRVNSIRRIHYDDSKRTGPYKLTRRCNHRVTTETYSPGRSWKVYNSSSRTERLEYTNYPYPQLQEFNPLVLPDLSGLHMEALQFFKSGCVDQELDLVTNLFELKSLRSTFDFITKKLSFKKRIASAHLSYSFGVKPLINDVKALYGSLNAMESKVRWLRKVNGKVIPVKFTKNITDMVPFPSTRIISSDRRHINSEKVTAKSALYTAYALIRYDVTALTDLELKLRYLTRITGFDNPLGVIWENIPYSFLVDWFFRVGDFLGTLVPRITIPYRFIDTGWTYKVRFASEGILDYTSLGISGLPWTYCTRDHKYFIRRPGLPLGFGAIATGDPGLRQLALGISLAIQKFGR